MNARHQRMRRPSEISRLRLCELITHRTPGQLCPIPLTLPAPRGPSPIRLLVEPEIRHDMRHVAGSQRGSSFRYR